MQATNYNKACIFGLLFVATFLICVHCSPAGNSPDSDWASLSLYLMYDNEPNMAGPLIVHVFVQALTDVSTDRAVISVDGEIVAIDSTSQYSNFASTALPYNYLNVTLADPFCQTFVVSLNPASYGKPHNVIVNIGEFSAQGTVRIPIDSTKLQVPNQDESLSVVNGLDIHWEGNEPQYAALFSSTTTSLPEKFQTIFTSERKVHVEQGMFIDSGRAFIYVYPFDGPSVPELLPNMSVSSGIGFLWGIGIFDFAGFNYKSQGDIATN